MKTLVASNMKNNRKLGIKIPREGTHIRKVYDLFAANKGKIISFETSDKKNAGAIRDLRLYYGCELKSIANGRWMLVGEYIDQKYVSYFEP